MSSTTWEPIVFWTYEGTDNVATPTEMTATVAQASVDLTTQAEVRLRRISDNAILATATGTGILVFPTAASTISTTTFVSIPTTRTILSIDYRRTVSNNRIYIYSVQLYSG